MKKILLIICTNLLVLLLVELISMGVLKLWQPNAKKLTNILDSKPVHIQIQHTEYFCDSMHTFENLQEEMAKSILDKFPGSNQIWWFYGGSTTKSKDCGIEKNYPEFISKLNSQVEVHNFAHSGAKSSDQLEILKYNLKEGNKVDVVFWASWINELLFYMDQNIEFNNSEVLEKYPEFKSSKDKKLVNNHKMARVSKTLYKYSNVFKLLYHILIIDSEIMQYSSDELKGTKRFLEASFLNYKLNLLQIKKLKDQYNFDIIFLQPPYRESLKGEYEIPIGGDRKRIAPEFVEEYLKGLNKIRNDIDWKLDFINFKEELKEYCNG